MPANEDRLHDRVLAEYDILYGFRPEKPSEIMLGEGADGLAETLLQRLRSALGIEADGEPPEGTLADLIAYLRERWDGETYDEPAR